MSYFYPATIEAAIRLLANHAGRARVIAGGTDLMPAIRDGKIDPEALVDITRVPGLDRIEFDDAWITVGAAVTFAMLRDSAFLRARVPALAQAAASVGAAPLQEMATWAGNVVQAMPAADGGVAAVALEAEAHVVDAKGARWVAVESLYTAAKTSAIDSTRQVITHLRFPAPPAGWGCAWQRIGRRPSLTLPILSCAATLRIISSTAEIESATIALGPVAALPFRARGAEASLAGHPADDGTFERAGELAREECHPRTNPLRASAEYRGALIPAIVRAALSAARTHATGRMPQY
jgi:carbon-monoxide dehydrogenase medium subunit